MKCLTWPSLTLVLDGQGWDPDIIVGAPVGDDHHDLSLAGLGLAEELLGSVSNGGPCAGATTPVADALDVGQNGGLGAMLPEAELQTLLIGLLHGAHAHLCV